MDLITSQSNINNDQVKRNFIESLKSPKTKTNYINSLRYFMDFLKIDRENYSALMTAEPLIIQSRIIDYIIYCRDFKKLSPGTIHTDAAAIKHFYSMNDIELKWKKIHSFEGEFYRVVEDRAYTHEEIKKMVDIADIRDKALLLMLASTGMRLGAEKLLIENNSFFYELNNLIVQYMVGPDYDIKTLGMVKILL